MITRTLRGGSSSWTVGGVWLKSAIAPPAFQASNPPVEIDHLAEPARRRILVAMELRLAALVNELPEVSAVQLPFRAVNCLQRNPNRVPHGARLHFPISRTSSTAIGPFPFQPFGKLLD